MIWAGTMDLLTPYANIKDWVGRLTSRPAYQRATSR